MKRSNRLVLLVGVFLAIVAFLAVLLLRPGTPTESEVKTTQATVIATQDIPLGARITAEQVTVEEKPLEGRDTDAFGDVSQVIGQKVRQPVTAGAAITQRTLSGGTAGQILDIEVPAGRRAMTVQVDQVTGVGTVIKTGDYVDMVVGIRADKFPVVTANPADDSITVVAGINGTSVKLLLQGMQVLGTLLPPPPAATQEGQQPGQGQSGTALTGQQEIVALSVDPLQAEVIKFAQMDGEITLILRSGDDFLDPTTGQPIDPPPLPDPTTGIILKSLVDRYGVLPPELIETVLPAQARR
ncbi:MAG TPA: Flp pilus assembly protein CpaB [Candidatus Limnocylindrales bacterium]